MYHFASTYSPPNAGSPGSKSDKHTSLNATQQKSSSNPFFLKIEEELHDVRRVRSHGQEEDLRLALDMVISRVSELSTMLSEVYKTQADLEVQLNVTKSNLQLVSSNNEMLEEALKRNNGAARDVGWRRGNSYSQNDPRTTLERSQSVDYAYPESPPVSGGTPTDNRFFKFRFSSASAQPTRPSTRPGTPSNSSTHLTSPSMPSLTPTHVKELEDLAAELEKERAAKKAITDEKAALEEELESLSQALFEEANNMVAQERMKLSETEEELRELKLEKEALQSALRLMDKQHKLHRTSSEFSFVNAEASASGSNPPSPPGRSHSRSSSQIGVKSRPQSLDLTNSLPPLPPSPFPDPHSGRHRTSTSSSPPSPSPSRIAPVLAASPPARTSSLPLSLDSVGGILSPTEEDSQPTPRYQQAHLQHTNPSTPSSSNYPPLEDSPWADVPSSAGL